MSLEVPPFPLSNQHPSRPLHEHDHSTTSSNVSQSSRISSRSSLDRTSDDSSTISMFQSQSDSFDESIPPVSSYTGSSSFEFEFTSSTGNPHSAVTGIRALVVNRTNPNDTWPSQNLETLSLAPPTPPAFLESAFIDTPSLLFKGFELGRRPRRESYQHNLGSPFPGGLHGSGTENHWDYYTADGSECPPSPKTPTTTNHDRRSRRTSFSFCITNPGVHDPELTGWNMRARLSDASMSSMNVERCHQSQYQGTYQPRGAPALHDI